MTTWTCVVCGEVHPIDHEGMFCGRCAGMACCSCEKRMHEHACLDADEFGRVVSVCATVELIDLRASEWCIDHAKAMLELEAGDSLGCKRCMPRTRLAMMADEERKARDAALQRLSDAEYEARKGAVYRREVRGAGWIADLKRQINALKESTPCMDCKGKFSAVAMDFDHRPGETKVGDVSKLAKFGKSAEVLFAEIAKCDLVCSNCHRVRTFKRGQHGP